jgi:hypothetical protein
MRAFLQYSALVGIFLLGVLGILRLGSRLQAPASVGGHWTLHLTFPNQPDAVCAPSWLGTGSTELVISQSGPELTLTWNSLSPITFKGELSGVTIHAASKDAPGWRLVAEVDRQADPDVLKGTLVSETCAGSIQLGGVRQPHDTSLTGKN